MDSVIDRYRRRQAPSPSHCEPKPQPCSTCGMLECLCRPRFFAGQVLTADDLNRLDYYIRAKHRLHNRQLHGWGVVNGLEVTCDACGPGVVVGCGYALNPCGDDIVVCDAVVVDVCRLIKECRQVEQAPCDPPRHPAPRGCEEGEEEWILAIRYSEAPTRAVKPLMPSTANACCATPSTCGCGAPNGKCTCEAGGARPRRAPVQCEPTVVCEGYDFAVYRKPEEKDDRDARGALNPDSELHRRFACCIELLVKRMPQMPGTSIDSQNIAAWHQWMCRFKEFLQGYLSRKPGYNCELLARLNAIVCPPVTGSDAAAKIMEAGVLLVMVWLDALLACYCSALLPPCPVAHPDGLVPLATIRVSGQKCRVISICNWTRHRKFATTFPALQYWLSIFPFGTELRLLIEKLCCFQIMGLEPRQATAVPVHDAQPAMPSGEASNATDFASAQPFFYERAEMRLNPTTAHPDRLRDAAALAAGAAMRGNEPLDPQALFESVFLAEKDKGGAHLSGSEVANLPQFLALNQLLRPLAADALSIEAIAPALMRMGPAAGAGGETESLREALATLRADVAKQAAEIKSLKAAAGHRKKGK